jgi:hypothetical protein
MKIMSPAEVKQFDWSDEKELPQETSGAAAPAKPVSNDKPTPVEPTADEAATE